MTTNEKNLAVAELDEQLRHGDVDAELIDQVEQAIERRMDLQASRAGRWSGSARHRGGVVRRPE